MFNCKCCVQCGKSLNSKIPYCAVCDEEMEYIESLFKPHDLELVGKELIWRCFISPGCKLEAMKFERPGDQYHSYYD